MAERHRHERHLAGPFPVDKGSAPRTVIHHETVSLLNPTPEEVEAGTNYWTLRWLNLVDTALADSAWAAMCAGFRPGRA